MLNSHTNLEVLHIKRKTKGIFHAVKLIRDVIIVITWIIMNYGIALSAVHTPYLAQPFRTLGSLSFIRIAVIKLHTIYQ